MQEFIQEIYRVMSLAEDLYGVDLSEVDISFNLRGRVAGQAIERYQGSKKFHELRFNKDAISLHYDEMFNEVIPHEIAHIVKYLDFRTGANHDRGWQNVAISLGCSGKTRHNMKLPAGRKVTKYQYVASCGTRIDMSVQKHRYMQNEGVTYTVKRTGGIVHRKGFVCQVISGVK
jgi:predicted SprT family Zn-dependent metalloprotease